MTAAALREARAEVKRLTALLHAKEAWIEGAKVDLDGYDEARDPRSRREGVVDRSSGGRDGRDPWTRPEAQ